MLTKEAIDEFFNDLEKRAFRFPVAALVEATGFSKGNISKYLKDRKPSENFVKKYYKVFPKSSNNVSQETSVLLEALVQLVKTQNKILEDQKTHVGGKIDDMKEKVVNTDLNVSKLLRALENVGTQIQSGREVILASLERLEEKPADSLQSEVYKKIVQKGQRSRKQSKPNVSGKIGKAS